MQRYYFHIHTGERLVHDATGMLLPDLASALLEARRASQTGIKNAKQDWSQWRIEVAGSDGVALFIYPFVSARSVTDRREPLPIGQSFRIRLWHLWASLVGLLVGGVIHSPEGRGSIQTTLLPYKLNGDDRSRRHRRA